MRIPGPSNLQGTGAEVLHAQLGQELVDDQDALKWNGYQVGGS